MAGLFLWTYLPRFGINPGAALSIGLTALFGLSTLSLRSLRTAVTMRAHDSLENLVLYWLLTGDR